MANERPVLWAPWRIDWILAPKSEETGCPLCLRAEQDALLIHADEQVIVCMNKYPYGTGHLLVFPTEHLEHPKQASKEVRSALDDAVHHAMDALQRALSPEGMNIGMNLGAAAGAGVPGHFHWHVLPRWGGDTNFLSTLADIRTVPEHIRETRDRIRSCW